MFLGGFIFDDDDDDGSVKEHLGLSMLFIIDLPGIHKETTFYFISGTISFWGGCPAPSTPWPARGWHTKCVVSPLHT